MKNSKVTKRRTGGWVVACVILAAALAFTAVFAQEGAEQEKNEPPKQLEPWPVPKTPRYERLEETSKGHVAYRPEALNDYRYAHTIQIKFDQGTRVRLREGKFVTLSESEEEQKKVERLNKLLAQYGVTEIQRVFEEGQWDTMRREIEEKTGKEQPDLNLWFDLDIKALSMDEKLNVFTALSVHPLVEAADFEMIFIEYSHLIEWPLARAFAMARGEKLKTRPKLKPYIFYPKQHRWTTKYSHSQTITVKFHQGTKVRLRNGELVSLSDAQEEHEKLKEVTVLLEKYGINKIERLYNGKSEEEYDQEREAREAKCRCEKADHNLSFELDVQALSEEERLEFINALLDRDIVETADFAAIDSTASLLKGPLIRHVPETLLTAHKSFDHNRCTLRPHLG